MADDDLDMSSSAEFEEKPEVVQEEEPEAIQEEEPIKSDVEVEPVVKLQQEGFEENHSDDDILLSQGEKVEQVENPEDRMEEAEGEVEWVNNPLYTDQSTSKLEEDSKNIVDEVQGVDVMPENNQDLVTNVDDKNIEWHDNPVYEAPPPASQTDDTQEIVAAIEQAEEQGVQAPPVIVEDHSVHVDGNNNVVTGAGNITQGGAGAGVESREAQQGDGLPSASNGADKRAQNESSSGSDSAPSGKRPGEGPYFQAAYNEDGSDKVDPGVQMFMDTLDDSSDALSKVAKNLEDVAKDTFKPSEEPEPPLASNPGPTGAA